MKMVVVSVVGVSSVILAVMIHTMVNQEALYREELRSAIAVSMKQAMREAMEEERSGVQDKNEIMAIFLQSMIQKVDPDTSLTVRVYEMDEEKGTMEVEAVSQYTLPNQKKGEISVRRRMIFARGDREEIEK